MPTLKEIINGFGSPTQTEKALALLSEAEREEYKERAAIMEYDGGLPRSEAERLALSIVVKRRTEE